MSGYIKDRYSSKLNKKQQRPKPQHWRLTNLLKTLHLKFQERDVGTPLFHVLAPDFGILFRFNAVQPLDDYKGWEVIDVALAEFEKNQGPFTENLMWHLISKGYVAYLRDPDNGYFQVFHNFIQREGWGLKIIEKRLELYNNEPRNTFLIRHNKKLRDMSISYILNFYPDFFDYLW